MHSFLLDLRFALRTLRKTPGFTAAAVLTLGLGIGASAAIFGVADAVLLSPLPVPQPERLIALSETEEEGQPGGNTSFATFDDWRTRSDAFKAMSLVRSWTVSLTGITPPERLAGLRVSHSFFRTLGVQPLLGRNFTAAEDTATTRYVVILSHGLWQRRFGGDPTIVGSTITLTGRSYEVAGVMPADFQPFVSETFYEPAEIWAPLGYEQADDWACRTCRHLKAIGRLHDGLPLRTATARMNDLAGQLKREHPDDYAYPGVALTPFHEEMVGAVRPALQLLLGAVGLVMLVACANVANLFLLRSAERRREIAIRRALGAGGGGIVRLLLAESLVMALLSGAVGLFIAIFGTDLLLALRPLHLPGLEQAPAAGGIAGFTALLALLTALLSSLLPGWRAARGRLEAALTASGRGLSASRGRQRLRSTVVVGQIALALVLLVGAGLLLRSFARLLAVDPGFETANLLTMQLATTGAAYEESTAVLAFYRTLMEQLAALPGVEGAAAVSTLPLGGNYDRTGIELLDRPAASPEDEPNADRYVVTADYFRTLGIPLQRGRVFTLADSPEAAPVAIVSDTMGRRLWPGEDPLGKQLRLGGPSAPWRTVIGIVGDVRHYGLDTPLTMQIYLPHVQNSFPFMTLTVRTAGPPTARLDDVRRAVWRVDPDQPVFDIAPMATRIATSVAQRRFSMLLLTAFAATALLLAAVGIYGVLAYTVRLRYREIGVRLAFGARSQHIVLPLAAQGVVLTVIGLGLGVVCALALTGFLGSLLFEIHPYDPLTFATVALLFLAVALLATALPARRAARVDPLVVLRYD